jgi:hypothetical protein
MSGTGRSEVLNILTKRNDQGGPGSMKLRLYKLAFALSSLAAIVEVLGAGRRF